MEKNKFQLLFQMISYQLLQAQMKNQDVLRKEDTNQTTQEDSKEEKGK